MRNHTAAGRWTYAHVPCVPIGKHRARARSPFGDAQPPTSPTTTTTTTMDPPSDRHPTVWKDDSAHIRGFVIMTLDGVATFRYRYWLL